MMGQTLTKDEILDALWEKHEAIYDLLQELNGRLSAADRPDYEGVLSNGELEIARVSAVYDMIDNNKQIPYPSDEQVEALAKATGALQQITDRNTAYENLAKSATALIKTWPVSRGG